jgi:hypothetical protein
MMMMMMMRATSIGTSPSPSDELIRYLILSHLIDIWQTVRIKAAFRVW